MRRPRHAIGALAALLLLAAVGVFVASSASVPRYDGTAPLPGLRSPAEVSCDALGVLTIEAADALDAARAFGYAAAQERFFEMDLLRRSAAGELAELFGAATLPLDRERRLHRFRDRAGQALASLDPAIRARLAAHVASVNAGLADLAVRPWQYLLLRLQPRRWRDEDSLPVGYAMFFDLQGREFGASMRMAVAPGREAEGILHMPGGQSGHPMSPFCGAGHDD